jgi:hypothetical protein
VEGFKANPKMRSDIACFKEGGSVYKSRTHKEDPTEAAEDKAMVKKGIRQHESAKHKGEEKTEIKLRNGGRCKKDGGTVRKYKTGGVVNVKKDGGAIEMKKGKDDKKSIAQTKKAKPGKADAPSAASGKKKESPATGNRPAKKTMNASMVGALPATPEAPSAAMGMPEDQPIEMMADGGYLGSMTDAESQMMGQGVKSDAERRALMMALQKRRRQVPTGANFGPLGQQAPTQPFTEPNISSAAMGAGMGAAAAPGPMGGAAPMGATQDIMRGLQALGQYSSGGEVC